MPVYKTIIRPTEGEAETFRLVKADSAAKARDHIVSAESLSADELAELIEGGAKIEKAIDTGPLADIKAKIEGPGESPVPNKVKADGKPGEEAA